MNGEASQANLTHAALLTFGLKHILDYGDLIVAPGLIDTHVHMDQPGRTNWEGAQHAQHTCSFQRDLCMLLVMPSAMHDHLRSDWSC